MEDHQSETGGAEQPKPKATKSRTKKKVEEPEKRGKGRPKKIGQEKSGYNHVLFHSDLFKSVNLQVQTPLTDEQRRERQAAYLAKLVEIVQEDASSEYYWRMVFTYTFYLYRSRKQMQAVAGQSLPPTKLPTVSLSDMAEDAKMEYFNLKNLFFGRGTARNVFCFLRFLYSQSIDFNQVQYNENIIDRAYTFLTVLRQDGMDPEEVKRLFYK